MEVIGNFSDFYGTTMLPALREVAGRNYRRYPAQWPQIFQVLSSTRSVEQFSQVSGVGRAAVIPEGAAVRRDQAVQGFNSSFLPVRWGLSVPVTRDMVINDKWNLVGTLHSDLGWSIAETQELDAVGTFNNAFSGSFLGPDGVSLCSASHPLFKAGGNQSNVGTSADLDMISLQLGLTAFELFKRPSGEYLHAAPARLAFHPSNRWIAHALLKSKDDPTTTDRSTNPLGGSLDGLPSPFAWKYLTAQDSWFLVAEPQQTGLVWFWRERPYVKNWTDDETEVGVTAMRYTKSHGWYDYIGVWGNAGV